ncbi:MAG: LD-carboxypeptidase [bacterium]|nr:LD-carboxypeptidase [bacterium]
MKVYVVHPAWKISKGFFISGIKRLEKIGFEVINKDSFYIDDIRNKVEELHKAFLSDADLVVSSRGGFGSIKLLPYLDFGLIKKNPKRFCGFSDISVLLNVIYEKAGLITYHSPMIINFSSIGKFSLNSFMNVINSVKYKNLFEGCKISVLKDGKASGILKGGNLTTLTALIGTKWEIDTKNSILFFEDVSEKIHSLERAFVQWYYAGKFKHINGMILGSFNGVNTFKIFEILKSMLKDVPIVYNSKIGHVKNMITIPIGVKVELNTFNKTLEVIE